jgi:peptidoglycan lytic transglycosylase A
VASPVVACRRRLAPAAHREPDDEHRKGERDARFDEKPDHRLLLCRLSLAALGAIGAACTTLPPPSLPPTAEPVRAVLKPAAFGELPGWTGDPLLEAWAPFLTGCKALVAQASTAAIWRVPCAAASAVDARDSPAVRAFFETYFSAYQAIAPDGAENGLVTGYYEPLLEGSRTPSEFHRYPLFAPPDDLLTVDLGALYPELKDKRVRGRLDGRRVVPYWSRADIEGGQAALAGKELVFVDDALEAFFLQIQGSGRIRLAEGGTVRVGYADQNGHPFRSIARILLERGAIQPGEATLQGLKDWARAHPEELVPLLNENPSYVFFREVTPDPAAQVDGPIGTLGVPLAAGRAIAVDPRSIPLGAPVFLATTRPLTDRPLRRLVFAQDTGGAIRGALRADFFWGFGDEAAREAGRMKQPGRLWILWPKGAPLPR